jgi:hypothetical protein
MIPERETALSDKWILGPIRRHLSVNAVLSEALRQTLRVYWLECSP